MTLLTRGTTLGAIFISTLAYQKLPHAAPGTDPQTQAELLAASIQPIIAFVVLCSILVHGLSIPFFSLGRRVHTVSRTWSRHSGVPDWTTLTRRVSKAEDIVINRDPRDVQDQLERGEVTPAATIREKEDASLVQIPTVAKVGGGDESSGSRPVTSSGVGDGGEAGEREGSIAEWREGPHQVIERAGPNGEVRPIVFYYSVSWDVNQFLSNPGRGRSPPKRLCSRERGTDDLQVFRRGV